MGKTELKQTLFQHDNKRAPETHSLRKMNKSCKNQLFSFSRNYPKGIEQMKKDLFSNTKFSKKG